MGSRLKRSKKITFTKEDEASINKENKKLLDRYIMDISVIRDLSEASIYNYERDLINWLTFISLYQDNKSVVDIETEEVEEFIFFCKKQGNNNRRLKRRLSAISAFYGKFLIRKGYTKINPVDDIIRPKSGLPVEKGIFLTKEQVEEIREKLSKLDDLQLTVYFELSLVTMARVGAISNIKWEQIDYDNKMILDVVEKGRRVTNLFLTDNMCNLLKELYKYRKQNKINEDYVFLVKYDKEYRKASDDNLRGWAKKIGRLINEPELSPHDFRRTGATLRSHAGQPFEEISSLLNHKGLDVTRRYVKEDISKKQRQFEKFEI